LERRSKRARKVDIKQVLHRIYAKGMVTKPELAREFGMSTVAISEYFYRLQESGWIESTAKADSTGGRRPQLFQLCSTHRYVIGINMRKSHFYLFLASLSGELLANRLVHLASTSFDFYVGEICRAVHEVLAETSVDRQRVIAIGICISGVTDFHNKMVDRSAELNWTGMPLTDVLEEQLGIPAFVENDSRVYARNEIDPDNPDHIGVVVYFAHSVGLALVIGNRVFQGATNRAGDSRFYGDALKRMREIIENDPIIHEITSRPYYSSFFEPREIEELNKRFKAYMEQNPDRAAVMDDFITKAAELMISLINIINPHRILLTGNVFDYTDEIYRVLKEKIKQARGVYAIPEVWRTANLKNPLETALVKFVMEKFFEEDRFTVDLPADQS